MNKLYKFECYDQTEQKFTKVEFSTENECWDGIDGPMYQFFTFLKGCGFVFKLEDQIGIMNKKGDFTSATE